MYNVLDACISITRASGMGLGAGNGEFFGPCEMAPRAQKTRDFKGSTPSQLPKQWICMHPNHYAQGCINHRCIGGFMYKSPRGRFQGSYCGGGGWGSRCIKGLHPARAAQVYKGT